MWFLTQELYDAMHSQADLKIDAEALEAFMGLDRGEGKRIMSVEGSTATINVQGVLTNTPNIMAELFGGGNTTYPEIAAAIHQAEGNDKVTAIDFNINSGGGSVDGMFDTMALIAGMGKPTRAVVNGLTTSAAYGIASQTNEIVATRPTDTVGSIGIATAQVIEDDVVHITSTNAPNKRPDASTEEGRKVIQAQLDEVESEFIAAIAEGRGVSTDTVKADFGRGGVMIARKGVASNVIDRILTPTSQSPATQQEAHAMDKKTLKAEHPELFAEIIAEGAAEAREHIEAHLELGKAGGEAGLKIALAAIEAGEKIGPKLTAQYQVAALKQGQIDARNEDEEETVVNTGKPPKTEEKDFETQVHEALFNTVGISAED